MSVAEDATRAPSNPVGEAADQQSTSDLVKQLTEQTQALAHKEIELAKLEVTEKGKRLGIGAGAIGAAGLIALFAFGALTTAIILILATAVEPWLAAAIVAAAYGLIAAVLALTGKKQIDEGTPPVPEQAIDSTKRDLAQARQSAKEGRS